MLSFSLVLGGRIIGTGEPGHDWPQEREMDVIFFSFLLMMVAHKRYKDSHHHEEMRENDPEITNFWIFS